MMGLKYTVIKRRKQYYEYCRILHDLVFGKERNKVIEDEIDLLTLLIEKWDDENVPLGKIDWDPVQYLKSFMEDHKLKAKDLGDILGFSKGYISDILNYKKGFSKQVIRKLADHFKVRQEAFNRPYELKGVAKAKVKSSVVRKPAKKTVTPKTRKSVAA